MTDTSSTVLIAVSQLLLDLENPRLPDIVSSQREAISTMAETQDGKLLELAQHLVDNGPNPASLLVVMPSGDDGLYSVLDGNRRVAALKLLENPALGEGSLGGKSYRKLKSLSDRFHADPIEAVICVECKTRDEADKWIQLTHRGQNKGAGLVEWDGQVAARYDARRGSKSFALCVLDHVRDRGHLSEPARRRIESGKFPITTLERLLKTPYVRSKLGIEKDSGGILTWYPAEQALRGMTKIVDDIGSKLITVSNLKSQEQRIDYVNSLDTEHIPDPDTKLAQPRPLDEDGTEGETAGGGATGGSKRRLSRERRSLVPKSCKLSIPSPKLRRLFSELKKLKADEFPNATAVLLRVFLELSLDHYLEHCVQWPHQQLRGTFLTDKLKAVADRLETKKAITHDRLEPVLKARGGQTLLACSVGTLHAYIHNRHFSPVASELRVAWDDLQPFLEALWADVPQQ